MINAAVLGSPINHSLSPLLHTIAYEHCGVQGTYEAIEVGAGDLSAFLKETQKNSLSLTMPLKEEALSLADLVSETARRISSGNTLSMRNGKWSLESTDVAGFEYSLKTNGVTNLDTVLILGAGATARAAVAYLSGVSKSIKVITRNPARKESMDLASAIQIDYLPWSLTQAINSADLVVNATPGNAADFFLSSIEKPKGVLFEVLYNPWPTKLAQAWSSSGSYVVDGLELLIHQAISQVEIFSQQQVDRMALHSLMRTAALKKLG
jgi:shikimate dehydrogenase